MESPLPPTSPSPLSQLHVHGRGEWGWDWGGMMGDRDLGEGTLGVLILFPCPKGDPGHDGAPGAVGEKVNGMLQ